MTIDRCEYIYVQYYSKLINEYSVNNLDSLHRNESNQLIETNFWCFKKEKPYFPGPDDGMNNSFADIIMKLV